MGGSHAHTNWPAKSNWAPIGQGQSGKLDCSRETHAIGKTYANRAWPNRAQRTGVAHPHICLPQAHNCNREIQAVWTQLDVVVSIKTSCYQTHDLDTEAIGPALAIGEHIQSGKRSWKNTIGAWHQSGKIGPVGIPLQYGT